MTILNVNKFRSLLEIEEVISSIESEGRDKKFVFSAKHINARHGPLYDASRLQMLVTLARRNLQADYLDIHPNTSIDNAIKDMCSYSPGIATLRLVRGLRSGSNEISRRDALKSATEKMHATDSAQYNKVVQGRILDLICVSGSKVQYLKPLFSADGVVKEHYEMRKTMQNLANFVNKQSSDMIPNSLLNSLGVFSTELMKNTQEHAVTDYSGKPYLAHVEGMMLGWTRLKDDLFADDFSCNSTLKDYWSNESASTDSGASSLRVFEVSYFDSGPGLVSRFTSQPVSSMTLEKERELLISCLKHKSTSKSQDAAGGGLPSVLSELKEIGGLIRIRSGRLSIFNAFNDNSTDRGLFEFEDWSDKKMAPVEGAVISILVPLRAK